MDWVIEELASLFLGDKRLDQRAQKMNVKIQALQQKRVQGDAFALCDSNNPRKNLFGCSVE